MILLGPEFSSEEHVVGNADIDEDGGGAIPKGRSIAHNIFNNQQAVFLSFDIKTAGEIAGIV